MIPNLMDYDWIVINSSAGKDSQAMLDFVVEKAAIARVPRERLVVVHADLGRVEWPGTRELAEEQARHYGLTFHVVRREQGDLLEHIEKRGMFPSPTALLHIGSQTGPGSSSLYSPHGTIVVGNPTARAHPQLHGVACRGESGKGEETAFRWR